MSLCTYVCGVLVSCAHTCVHMHTYMCGHIACVHTLVSMSYEYTMGVLCAHVCECQHIHVRVQEHVGGTAGGSSWLPCILSCFDSLPSPPLCLPQLPPLPASFLPGGPAAWSPDSGPGGSEWELITLCIHEDPLILLAPTEPLGPPVEAAHAQTQLAWGHHSRGSWAPKLALSRLISNNEPQILTGASEGYFSINKALSWLGSLLVLTVSFEVGI